MWVAIAQTTGTDLSLHLAVTPELVPYWHCDRAICLETLRPSSIRIWQIQGQPDRPLVWSNRFPPNSFRRIMELRAERRRLWPTKNKKC